MKNHTELKQWRQEICREEEWSGWLNSENKEARVEGENEKVILIAEE